MNNYIKIGFKPCPKCGSENISCWAFNLSPDCGAECLDCGHTIELEVEGEGDNYQEGDEDKDRMTVVEKIKNHDNQCVEALKKEWNNYKE